MIDEKPIISIIIATYNRSNFITKAIHSVLIQTNISWELIIVDDGSADATFEVIQPFLKDIRISYLSLSHSGVSRARNKGVEQSRGKWITFLDSDDEWKKDKLFKQHQALLSSKLIWNQTQEVWIRNGVFVNQPKYTEKKAGFIFYFCLKRCMVTPSSVMIQKNVFEKIGGFDENFLVCEDYELWLRFTSQFEIGLVKEKLLVRYGGHDDQLSGQYPAMDRFRIQAMDKMIRSKLLDQKQLEMCLTELKFKLKIYLQGCKKRKKWKEKKTWESLYQPYLG